MEVSSHHLAHFNVARLAAPIDSVQMASFVALLDPINELAEQSPGFVWRYTVAGENNAFSDRSLGEDEAVNLSVWESQDALWNFAYRSRHLDVMRQRRDWFQSHARPYQVLWWVPAGTVPTVPEALERLLLLEDEGPSPRAFTFREAYESDGQPAGASARAG